MVVAANRIELIQELIVKAMLRRDSQDALSGIQELDDTTLSSGRVDNRR